MPTSLSCQHVALVRRQGLGSSQHREKDPLLGLLVVQFLTVYAERLLTRSLNTVVHLYDNGKSALGIVVMKTFFPAMVSGHFGHSTPCALYREESITKLALLLLYLL
jgi:hypothetical protein